MKIEQISNKDINILKKTATKAILESVDVSDELKKEIISDTMMHIDINASSTESVFLKCTETDVIGFILIQEYWNLSDLFVLPKAHGRGVGKALFKAAKSLCMSKQNKGYIRVNLSVNAEGFYRNIGFQSFIRKRDLPSFVVPLIYNL